MKMRQEDEDQTAVFSAAFCCAADQSERRPGGAARASGSPELRPGPTGEETETPGGDGDTGWTVTPGRRRRHRVDGDTGPPPRPAPERRLPAPCTCAAPPSHPVMARTGTGTLLSRRNVKLDSFLKRNTERTVYERIRVHEPCVVQSDSVNKVYMHVVLTDERVYLTEYPPRTLTAAVSFGRVRDIELVNDLPEFLSAKDREHCQHIRIVYVAEKPQRKGHDWLTRERREELPPVAPPLPRMSPMITSEGRRPDSSLDQWKEEEPPPLLKSTRSASCPNPETLGLLRVPHPPGAHSPFSLPPSPPQRSLEKLQGTRRIGLMLNRLLRRDRVDTSEEKEAELHLYAVSHTSRIYLHLQSAWNSFIIRSTLLFDPRYRRRCSGSTDASLPSIGWERTAHLLGQLSSELLQDGISLETRFLLLQELRTAAHRSLALRRLFWRCGELCVFLVGILEDCLGDRRSLEGGSTADQLLLSTLVVQTLAIMFRETEVEAARINLLSAKKGALASRLLLALVCGPEPRRTSTSAVTESEVHGFLEEYQDAACWLLFEMLLLGYETSRSPSTDSSRLTVGWILRVLQPHPHLLPFISHQAQQVVLVLSDPQDSALSPTRSVLLFQRCRLLLACLQHNNQLAEHLRSHFSDEFRYYVKPSWAEVKLPPHFPISRPTVHLVDGMLAAILKT